MALITKTIPGFQQGVDKRFRYSWPGYPELTLEPESDKATALIRMFRNVSGSYDQSQSVELETLTKATGELILFPNAIEVVIPGEKSVYWELEALSKAFTRTATGTAGDQIVTIAFPLQLVYIEFSVTDANNIDRAPGIISGTQLELEYKTGVRYAKRPS